jgi:hypothetical protein
MLGAGGNGNIATVGERNHAEGVLQALLRGDIARDNGDGADIELRRIERQHERHGVIGSGIGIKDDSLTGAGSGQSKDRRKENRKQEGSEVAACKNETGDMRKTSGKGRTEAGIHTNFRGRFPVRHPTPRTPFRDPLQKHPPARIARRLASALEKCQDKSKAGKLFAVENFFCQTVTTASISRCFAMGCRRRALRERCYYFP